MMGAEAAPGTVRIRRGVVWIAISAVLALVTPASAQLQAGARADESAFWSEAGWGAGAACTNLLYIPAKLVYAGAGGLIGGLAWAVTLGSTETSNAVWEPTLGGDYVLTPGILAGTQPLHFNGPPAPIPPARSSTFQESEAP